MTLTSQNVLDALSAVIDPEIRRPITDLNMVDSINIDGSTVSVTILLTTAGCPLRTTISDDVNKTLSALDGVTDVKVTMDVMNDEQKKALREKLNGGRPEREILFARPDSLTRVIAHLWKGRRRQVLNDRKPCRCDGSARPQGRSDGCRHLWLLNPSNAGSEPRSSGH